MKVFPLLINGEYYDTGKYRYLPYADKSILDPLGALRTQRDAQKGIFNDQTESYLFAKVCVCEQDDVEKAIKSAADAALIFKAFSFARRLRIAETIHELLIDKKDHLIDLMVIEGHPKKLAQWEFSGMELAYQPTSLRYFKSQLRGMLRNDKSERIGWVRKPDGVVCVSPPGNASCSNSLTAGFALLGGNSVIVKPTIRCPVSTLFLWHEIVWEALKRNGAPRGVVNTVIGNSASILNQWLSSPLVNDILFFGKSEEGMKIGARAFQAGKKPILELSGNDMLLVWKDCNIDGAVNSLMDAFLGSTQICMVPKKALIHEDIFDAFKDRFRSAVQKLKIGLPSDSEVCLTPVARIEHFFEFMKDAVEKGAKILSGGERVNHLGAVHTDGCFLEPTILTISDWKLASGMKCVREENFFPLIPLIKISSNLPENAVGTIENADDRIFANMVNLVNRNKYGLRTSVWVKSEHYIAKFIKELDTCGLIRINSQHTGFSPYLSTHGGTGLSGGPFGEMNYIWQKTTHLQGVTVLQSKCTEGGL